MKRKHIKAAVLEICLCLTKYMHGIRESNLFIFLYLFKPVHVYPFEL